MLPSHMLPAAETAGITGSGTREAATVSELQRETENVKSCSRTFGPPGCVCGGASLPPVLVLSRCRPL
ncbi:hypothetical protein FKM82_029880 [Ascaphus truei]